MVNNQLLQDMGRVLGTNIDFNEDIREISEVVKGMLQEKYVNRIKGFVQNNRMQIQENPTNEIALLEAVKPFMNANIHPQVDHMIEIMNTMRMFQNLNEQFKSVQLNRSKEREGDNLEQDDGVYEVDEVCMNRKNQSVSIGGGGGIFIILLLVFLFIDL